MEIISDDVNKLQAVFAELAAASVADDEELYACPLCRDTGYVLRGDRAYPCACRHKALLRERRTVAGLTPRLLRMNFANFDLRFYPQDRRLDSGASYRLQAEKALDKAREFVSKCTAGCPANGLLLTGEVGSGKTHLAAAIANALTEREVKTLFLVVPEFLDQLRGSYRRENEGLDDSELTKQAYEVPVLILDDLGAHNFTEWVTNKLFTIINYRYNHNLPCVITTNLSLDELDSNIGYRTTSRLIEACDKFTLIIDRDVRIKKEDRMKTDAVIFDFDDTLVHTNAIFDAARLKVFDELAALGVGFREQWDEFLNAADIANIAKRGFLADACFPLAIRETYEHFARLSRLPVSAEAAERLEAIGWRVFTAKPETVEGAEEVLAALSGKVRLFLLTQGEQQSQYARLAQSGLLLYFDAHRIVSIKSEQVYTKFIEDLSIDCAASWMVGNSIRADINPALAVGMNAVHFAASAWSYDHVELTGQPHVIHKLHEFLELIEL